MNKLYVGISVLILCTNLVCAKSANEQLGVAPEHMITVAYTAAYPETGNYVAFYRDECASTISSRKLLSGTRNQFMKVCASINNELAGQSVLETLKRYSDQISYNLLQGVAQIKTPAQKQCLETRIFPYSAIYEGQLFERCPSIQSN